MSNSKRLNAIQKILTKVSLDKVAILDRVSIHPSYVMTDVKMKKYDVATINARFSSIDAHKVSDLSQTVLNLDHIVEHFRGSTLAKYQTILAREYSTSASKPESPAASSSLVPQLPKQPILGTSDFEKIITKDAFFVDKTMFIKEFIEEPAEVVCILRPRQVDLTHC